MNIFIKTFLVSFLFFSVLLFVVHLSEDFMNKQGIYYPPIFNTINTRSMPVSQQVTPIPVASVGNGDANLSNTVNFEDVEFVSDSWNYSVEGSVDQYKDGKVNSLDFAVIADQLAKQK